MKLRGKVHKYGADVNTDVIIPARYLNVYDPAELAQHCMEDLDPEFLQKVKPGDIIVAGTNFGCGSSREHAPWALVGNGIRAVISTSFADIFKNNALKNGILPIVVNAETHEELSLLARTQTPLELTIDLGTQTIRLPNGTVKQFPIDGFARTCLLDGTDELGYLLRFETQISEYEKRLL